MKCQKGFICSKLVLATIAAVGIAAVAISPSAQETRLEVPVQIEDVTKGKPALKKKSAEVVCKPAITKVERRTRALALVLALKDPRAIALSCRG